VWGKLLTIVTLNRTNDIKAENSYLLFPRLLLTTQLTAICFDFACLLLLSLDLLEIQRRPEILSFITFLQAKDFLAILNFL
jgi:hypothetical protein